ncbi:MAG: bifunctional precorrin-2 dehydrogenase/sirohydrochlorin ferrochelatase [Bdellovibrionales bacterium]
MSFSDMFPIVLNPEYTNMVLVGNEFLTQKRLVGLRDANIAKNLTIYAPIPCHCMSELIEEMKTLGTTIHNRLPSKRELNKAHIVYIVDIDENKAKKLADHCRKRHILVNIEDVIPYCDFHTPSIVRRGDLLFSISTNGQSPGLGIQIRKHISKKFGPEWAERLEILAENRQKWRSEGLPGRKVLRKTIDMIHEKGWL